MRESPAGLLPITDRRLAAALSVTLVAAVLAPLRQNWRAVPRDGFPVSYYPMFTARRTRDHREHYLVGHDARGGRTRLPWTCAGSGGLNQVRRQIRRSIRGGRADELCAAVAAEVARRKGGRYRRLLEVRVVTGRFRLAEYFGGGSRKPRSERVRAACAVRRTDP